MKKQNKKTIVYSCLSAIFLLPSLVNAGSVEVSGSAYSTPAGKVPACYYTEYEAAWGAEGCPSEVYDKMVKSYENYCRGSERMTSAYTVMTEENLTTGIGASGKSVANTNCFEDAMKSLNDVANQLSALLSIFSGGIDLSGLSDALLDGLMDMACSEINQITGSAVNSALSPLTGALSTATSSINTAISSGGSAFTSAITSSTGLSQSTVQSAINSATSACSSNSASCTSTTDLSNLIMAELNASGANTSNSAATQQAILDQLNATPFAVSSSIDLATEKSAYNVQNPYSKGVVGQYSQAQYEEMGFFKKIAMKISCFVSGLFGGGSCDI